MWAPPHSTGRVHALRRSPATGDHLPSPDVFVRTKPYWNAFLGHEYVLVDGEPGRWATEAEAKSAAEAAYRAYLTESADRSTHGPNDDAIHHRSETGSQEDRPGGQPTGFLGNARSLFRAWRSVRRSHNAGPSPERPAP